MPPHPSDGGKGIIRVDGLVRNNAEVAIGDTVVARKIKEAIPAETVGIEPLERIPSIDKEYFANVLLSIVFINYIILPVPSVGASFKFIAISTTPGNADALLVTRNTRFYITPAETKVAVVVQEQEKQQEEKQKQTKLLAQPSANVGKSQEETVITSAVPTTAYKIAAKEEDQLAEQKHKEEQNQDLVQRFYREIFENGNLAAAAEILAPEFVFRSPSLISSSELADHGPECIEKLAAAVIDAMPHRRIIKDDVIVRNRR